MEDVVYLKNGSKVRGTIHYIIPDSIVRIEQAGGSIWVFPMKDVAMIDKEKKLKLKDTIVDTRGYHVGIDAGILIGSPNNMNNAPFGLHVINSYNINRSVSIGLGAGLEFFSITQIPVYLDVRYLFNRKFYAPYVFIQGGAMIPLNEEQAGGDGYKYKGEPGFMVNPGVGFLFPINEKSVFTISLSYRYHELYTTRTNYTMTDYTRIEEMNRLNLRIGFILR